MVPCCRDAGQIVVVVVVSTRIFGFFGRVLWLFALRAIFELRRRRAYQIAYYEHGSWEFGCVCVCEEPCVFGYIPLVMKVR